MLQKSWCSGVSKGAQKLLAHYVFDETRMEDIEGRLTENRSRRRINYPIYCDGTEFNLQQGI